MRAVLVVLAVLAPTLVLGQGLPQTTWPAGTVLSSFSDGGRINTFHRGYLYLGGYSRTTVYDISDPTNPQLENEWDVGENGHLWYKMGDLFNREYINPVVAGSGYRFADLSNLPDITPWTSTDAFPGVSEFSPSHLQFYPYYYAPWDNDAIIDLRTQEVIGNFDFDSQKGVAGQTKLRVGNLLFFVSGDASGVAVFDVGDPVNPRLLDVLHDGVTQYSDWAGIWRNYLVIAAGDNVNQGVTNMIAIDFSDPSNLEVAFGFPVADVGLSRYVFFQDEYGFMSSAGTVTKINMETREVDVVSSNVPTLHDHHVVPAGHLLVVSGSHAGAADDSTTIVVHQDSLDTNPPYVGYHLPLDGATNLPTTTVIGLVISESLEGSTVVPENLRLERQLPGGGVELVQVDVVHDNSGVVTIAPRAELAADSTYELTLIENGIRDVAQNGVEEFSFQFATGGSIASDSAPDISDLTLDLDEPLNGQSISFSGDASHSSGAVQYRWHFGDDTQATAWSTSASVSHQYPLPGHYTVLLQARVLGSDSQWYVSGMTTEVVVGDDQASTDEVRKSSPIVLDTGRRLIWKVNPDNDSVAIINADAMALVQEVSACEHPESVALDSQGRAWIACSASDELRVFDSSGNSVQTLALSRGARPSGILSNSSGSEIYVAAYGSGEILRFDGSSFGLTGAIDVAPTPKGLALTETGNLYVSHFLVSNSGAQVSVIGTSGALSLDRAISLPVDNTSVDNGASARGIPNYVRDIVIGPGEREAWYVAKQDNILTGLARDGSLPLHDTLVRSIVGRIDIALGSEDESRRFDIDDSSVPSAIVFGPRASEVFVTLQGNNRVDVLDVRTGVSIATADVGFAPQGIVLDSVTQRLFVHNFLSRSVTVLDASLVIEGEDRSLPQLSVIDTVSSEQLSSTVLRGKQVFYDASDARMSAEGYFSCASCHDAGGHDGQVWDTTDTGEGLRRTISLQGRGSGHGMIHWTGNFDEIQDFEINIRRVFGGSGFVANSRFSANPLGAPNGGASSDLDAMAAYVESLVDIAPSPYRQQNGSLTAAGVRGKQVFASSNCTDCHVGVAYTDSGSGRLHDVGTLTADSGARLGGTLTGLDTPTLLGLWQNRSFLHDGSAATISDVLEHPSSSQHGLMSTLSSGELQDLGAYLLQIDADDEPFAAPPEPPASFAVQ